MNTYSNTGYASTQFLFMLIFISAIIFGLGLYFNAYTRFEFRLKEKVQSRKAMEVLMELLLQDLTASNNLEIDCYEDPIWSWNKTIHEGYYISITPLSDRLNINFLDDAFLANSSLNYLFSTDSNPKELPQFRHDVGLSFTTKQYLPFFSQEILDAYFTSYGWANINCIDEFSAMNLAYALTSSKEATEWIRSLIQELRVTKNSLSQTNLKMHLGNNYDKFYPYFNTEPLMNVNFIPSPILKALITYPAYGISRAEDKYWEILERRALYGISSNELMNTLSIDARSPLAHYLGSITWFWEITLQGDAGSARWVICRLPDTQNSFENPQYIVIEKEYE